MFGGSTQLATTTMYAKLAKQAAEHFVHTQTRLALPAMVPSELLLQRACYVTILEKPGKMMRGMYGQPLPRESSLAEEIITNTLSALDSSVRRADLNSLTYIVATVNHLQRISDRSHLDPHQFGLYVRSDYGKQAVILPGRAGIETSDDQIATAFREAGIDPRHEPASMYRFRVTWYE